MIGRTRTGPAPESPHAPPPGPDPCRPGPFLAQSIPSTPKVAEPRDRTDHRVVRVVDGDTAVIEIGGKATIVRPIGVATPETVHPSKPVERFGKQASAYLRSTLGGGSANLGYEPERLIREDAGLPPHHRARRPNGRTRNHRQGL